MDTSATPREYGQDAFSRFILFFFRPNLSREELGALGVFLSYFGVIALCFWFVWDSLTDGVEVKRLFRGKPFFFIRVAVGALGCTWYFMIKFMQWSFDSYVLKNPTHHIPQWLNNTALFEQAWGVVCGNPVNWWWSSWICVWSVLYATILWRESAGRGIKYPWAYMLLGMLVAISVSTSLFIAAMYLHPRPQVAWPKLRHPTHAPPRLTIPLIMSISTIARTASKAGQPDFLSNLLWMHAFILIPTFFLPPRPAQYGGPHARTTFDLSFRIFTPVLLVLCGAVQLANTFEMFEFVSSGFGSVRSVSAFAKLLVDKAFSHPAQASISMDVIWVAISLACWYLVTGDFFSILGKSFNLAVIVGAGLIGKYGLNWSFLASLLPIAALLAFGLGYLGLAQLRTRNEERRKALMSDLGLFENTVVPGTKDAPPSKAGPQLVVGFWHPYCNAGGGGERVLWSAIAYIQRTQPETVVLIYSGDHPAASKATILGKAEDRFSIKIDPKYVRFVPLPSRSLISDDYWPRFTLLGQSLGSVWLAIQGLTGKEGIWGDVFIGGEIAIGAYTHYPTVSDDMAKRVQAGEVGVESMKNSSNSWLQTRGKLLYYRLFTNLYATSLLFSEYTMTNSTWTHGHITALLASAKRSTLASLLLLDEKTASKRHAEGKNVPERPCDIVFPPCDVGSLTSFGLERRGRGIVSLAQFRPEKEQSKQIHALARLFQLHPDYQKGKDRMTLTLMGGIRDAGDQARLDELKRLAKELDVEKNVEFLVNAPYHEIVQRLGRASIGLNTMQDEHFGINVVEFMAAGLIPVVHASAGPKMDIVVPFKGQITGYHATTADDFAKAIHKALSRSGDEQRAIRSAARKAAVEKFSTEAFEKGWDRGFVSLVRSAKQRHLA